MKKIAKLLLAVSLIALLATSVFAIEWKFDGTTPMNDWKYTGMNATQGEDSINLTMTSNDVYMSYVLKSNESFEASEYPYVAVVMKVNSIATYGTVFFKTSTALDMGKTYSDFTINNDGKWHGYVIDMSSYTHKLWSGTLTDFRIDLINVADMDAKISVNRAGIFKTKEEAEKFIETLPADSGEAAAPAETPKEEPKNEAPATSTVTGDCALKWIFDGTSPINDWKFSGMEASQTSEGMKLAMKANDVYMTYNLSEAERFEAQNYPYAAVVMKVKSAVNYGGFFFSTTETASMGPTYSNFGIKNDGEWHSYIINLGQMKHGLWKSTLTAFRLDVINAADLEADITIERIGIFSNEKAAEEFVSNNPAIIAQKEAEKAAAAEKELEYAKMDAPHWIFDSLDSVKEWSVGGADSVYRFGYLCLVPSTWDPTLTFTFDEPFPSSHFKYFAFRLKANSIFNAGALFFSNTTFNGFSDKSHTTYSLKQGEWVDIIINMEERFPERWVGEVNKIRLDPINGSSFDNTAEIYLDRLGFFRTEEDAKEFLSGGRSEFDYSESSVIVKEMSKTYVPAGAINPENFSESQFIIQNPIDVKGKNDAIVMYVDEAGNESIVPLSYVNGAGYATYVGAKPGTYKIGYNTKEFSDIAGHWANDYIKFVADRQLFGGTSATEFSPEVSMTRGMFITVLGRMHGVDTSAYDGNTGYSDVASTEYYAPYIQWAKEKELALPITETTFEPESPISRKDMALITSNYMNAFDYDIKLLEESEVEEFNDLAGFSDAEKAAIILIQRAGIINGKGEGRFDPAGVSTRAEVATVMQRIVKSVLRVNNLYTQYDYDYITRDRIRIGAWMYNPLMNNPEWFKTYIDAGFNMVPAMNMGGNIEKEALFDLADKYAIEMLTGSMPREDANGNASSAATMNASIYEHPSFNGAYLNDEPGTEDYPVLSAQANRFIDEMNGRIPFINLLPMYANAAQLKYNAQAAAIEYYDSDPNLYRKYCDSFCEQFNTHYICVDIYPLFLSGKTKSTYKDYVESINQVASSARDHGKDFWCCLQAFGWNSSKRTPNINEYAWQCYTLLSFGCKGLIWWYYEGNENAASLINVKTGETTQAYEDSKVIIAEINAISDTFIQYKNLGAFNVNYSSSVPYLRMSNPYENFDIISEVKCDDPLLVGCFEKKEGEGYAFTLVNMTELAQEKAVTVQVKLARDAVVTSYQNGTPTVLTANDGYYTFNLDWGMGTFVTID